jgi:predicted nucleotidyltransferase
MDDHFLDAIMPAGCILMTLRGSLASGTYIPSNDPNSVDDVDMMGVYVESPDFYMGLDHKTFGFGGKKSDTQEYWVDNYDIVNYEFRKLFGLLLKSNPNVLMLLFLNNEHVLYKDKIWDDVLENKDIFVSSKAFHSFGGYASEQLRKMTSFKNCLDADENLAQKIKDINLELGWRRSRARGEIQTATSPSAEYRHLDSQKLEEIKNKLTGQQVYMGEKRRGLVEEFGYDVKNAAHMIRLLRMGVEFLKRGTLTVDRTGIDADEIKEIKTGKWSLEDVINEGKRWEYELQRAFAETDLPRKPDFDAANQLCTKLIRKYYEELRRAG